ncbi:hypothetical protein Btru_020927 [Bulinus truncatus]|nr:hypothetical protein Btru_020927 [Bulinus truncatus]
MEIEIIVMVDNKEYLRNGSLTAVSILSTPPDPRANVGDLTRDIADIIIFSEVIEVVYIGLTISIHLVTSLLGVVTNAMNLVVLPALGLQNGHSVGVLALSVTDFLVTLLQLTSCLCFLLDRLFPGNAYNLMVLGNFEIGWLRYSCFFISGWIITLLSAERCCCVVMPFTVNHIFTKKRVVVVIVSFYALYISFTIPLYVVQKLTWESIPCADSSNVALLVCTAVMIFALRASSKVRHSSLLQASSSPCPKYSLTGREGRLVRVILGLALVLTACSVPRFADHAMRYAMSVSEFSIYDNLSRLLWAVSDVCGTLNCSVSFFVYWTLNSSFRKCFWEVITCFKVYHM